MSREQLAILIALKCNVVNICPEICEKTHRFITMYYENLSIRRNQEKLNQHNPERLRNEAALAALCGASPLQASSGKTTRHRLNRGGDRSANNALWTIAMVRMRSEPRTQAYVMRRTAQGMSNKEIQRCLKRYIVRELYPLILADL